MSHNLYVEPLSEEDEDRADVETYDLAKAELAATGETNIQNQINDYKYKIKDCDVTDKVSLEAYRAKRTEWLSWLLNDEYHAIYNNLRAAMLRDIDYKIICQIALSDPNNALNNPILKNSIVNGYIATQALAVRRLMDKKNISLVKLIKDMQSNIHLFTRENFVCNDGLPYDFEAGTTPYAENCQYGNPGGGYLVIAGPQAYCTSRNYHIEFGKLSSILHEDRKRTDRLPKALLDGLYEKLTQSDASKIKKWSETYLAHAGDQKQREHIADVHNLQEKITDVIKLFVEVSRALSFIFLSHYHPLLNASKEHNLFKFLDCPIMASGSEIEIKSFELIEKLTSEYDNCFKAVDFTNATA